MMKNNLQAMIAGIFAISGSILIGYGSNWMIGTGMFLCLQAIAGFAEYYGKNN
jgi:hypothetical protein